LSKPTERYRQGDVNFWGVMAIIASGIAVTASSLPALLPTQFFTAMHASRMTGVDLNALRAELVALRDDTARMRVNTTELMTRVGLAEKNRGDIVQRVGALENTLPLLVEQIPPGSQPIDASIVTSSVNRVTQTAQIDGGSVQIERTPLFPDQAEPEPLSDDAMKDLPAGTTTSTDAAPSTNAVALDLELVDTDRFGIAMGGDVTIADAYVTWIDYRNKVGALLIGMEPILSGTSDDYHVVAGPIDSIAQAEQLCGYIQRAGLQCLPVPYSGYRMPQ